MRILRYFDINWPVGERQIEYPLRLIEGKVQGIESTLRKLHIFSVPQLLSVLASSDDRSLAASLGISTSEVADLRNICRRALGQQQFQDIQESELPAAAFKSGLRLPGQVLEQTHGEALRVQQDHPDPVPPFSDFCLTESELGPVFNQGQRGTCVAAALKRLFRYAMGVEISVEYVYGMMKKLYDPGSKHDGAMLSWATSTLEKVGWVEETELPYDPSPIEGNPGHLPLGGSEEREKELIRMGKKNRIPSDDFLKLNPDDKDGHFESMAGHGKNQWGTPAPIEIGIRLFRSSLKAAKNSGGYMTEPLPSETPIGGHAMLVIGWEGDGKDDGYAILGNTWGDSLPVLYAPYKGYYCLHTR